MREGGGVRAGKEVIGTNKRMFGGSRVKGQILETLWASINGGTMQ